MSLDALAPDQRAVVQLVLQQDRSYGDLAGLLGITEDAVRERAHRGLERIAAPEGIAAAERADVADYLLGQQSVSGRETTRSLLAASPATAAWAAELAATLGPIARSPLPEIPGATASPPAVADEPITRSRPAADPAVRSRPAPDPTPEPVVRSRPRAEDEEPVVRARPRPEREAAAEEPVVRARPRPRASTPVATTETPAATTGLLSDTEEPVEPETTDGVPEARNSLFGGALLIAGLGILVAILIVWLVTKGDDGKGSDTASSGVTTTSTTSTTDGTDGSASATAGPTGGSGSADFVPVGTIAMKATDGSKALGEVAIFASQSSQQIGFQLVGQDLTPSAKGEAYGVWLIGGGKPHFLGYAPPVASSGKTAGQLGTTGPRESDQAAFAQWLQTSKTFVVTKETQENATKPGTVVLSGNIADFKQLATATATATP